jgi:hypothetical protein
MVHGFHRYTVVCPDPFMSMRQITYYLVSYLLRFSMEYIEVKIKHFVQVEYVIIVVVLMDYSVYCEYLTKSSHRSNAH